MKGSDIVRAYLKQYPNTSNTALARAIMSHHPDLYKNEESARRAVLKIVKKEFSKRKEGRTPFNFPKENNKNQAQTFHMPEKNRRILGIADLHLPFYVRECLELAINHGIKKDITTLVILGDLFDFPTLSRFLVSPKAGDLADELQMGYEVLAEFRKIFPDIEIIWKYGNHDFFLERYLWTDAPMLLGVPEFELKSLAGCDALDITVVPDKHDIRVNENLSMIHGHEIGGYSAISPAYKLFQKFRDNVICAHHHKASHYSGRTGTGRIISTWSMGALCQLRPEFMPINDWTNGFIDVETDGDEFVVNNYTIYKGKVYHA